jgi:hypothetical protein
MTTIFLAADCDQALKDVQLLAQAAKCSLQVRQRLLELCDLLPELICLHAEGFPAGAAGEVRIRFDLPDGFRELARAVRAGQFDGLSVEDAFHGGPCAS